VDKVGTDVETVVVGAGVIGLSVAAALSRAGQEVLVLERHPRFGMEVSSHNSEVIHAGLYYPPESLRAKLCITGRDLLYAFAREHGIPHRQTGKLLVATCIDEEDRLAAIASNAERAGIGNLMRLSPADVREIEPEISCTAAVLSPSTGIVDSHALMQALDGIIANAGGQIVFNTDVTNLESTRSGTFAVTTMSDGVSTRITARNLALAGGLGASQLGRKLSYPGSYTVPETYPAKGHYFSLKERAPFRHLVYPMPQNAWLGIHLTLDMAGLARFGPDLEWTTGSDASTNYEFEDSDGSRKKRFTQAIRRYWPSLPENALEAAYTGLRPKLYREDQPPADFAIHGQAEHGIPRLMALYGIESPGLTSSLAIAAKVAAMIEN
jgi:L-2-hydroxyglutarate oxidase LhgO